MKALCAKVPTLLKKPQLFASFLVDSLSFSTLSPQNPQPFTSSIFPEKFASVLNHCPDINSLKKLHACVLVHGLESDIFWGSKILHSYVRFDLLTESRWVFDKVINDDLCLWNSIFSIYSRASHSDEVLRLYVELRRRKIGLDSNAIIFSLKSCVQLGNLEFGNNVHADSYKLGLNAGCFVGSSLIGFYSKYAEIDVATKVFDEIIERDVVVYTSMVTAYAQVSDHRAYGAFSVVQYMQREELEPNRVTLVSLLKAASHLGALEEGKSVHGYAIRRGIGCLNEVFETSLMDMYIKCGCPGKAVSTFSKRSRRAIGSWNALITGYLQFGRPLKSLQLFLQMMQENHVPDFITLANGLLSCAYLGNLAGGKCIHGYLLRNGVKLDLVATTALINMYMKCNCLTQAKEVFDRIERKDVVSFSVMLAGYLENGSAFLAIKEFHEMVKLGLRPNISTILNVLCALSTLKDIRQGKCIHGYVFRHGFEVKTEIANQLINLYAKCRSMNFARQVFDEIENKDVVSWTSMITGLVNHGLADEAVIFFRLMQRGKFTPDSVTLLSLVEAFAQLGCLGLAREVHCHVYRVSLDEDISVMNSLLTTYSKCGKLIMARNLFEHMAKWTLSAWNSMISAYGMHGDCVQALKLFEEMKTYKVTPDDLTFKSVLSACSHSGFVVEGLRIFGSMKEEYGINPSDDHYNCMVDLLSRAGHLEEAHKLLKCLPSSENASALRALLAACRFHGNTNLGETIGRRLLELDPENPSVYSLVSNIYAEREKWEQVAKFRGTTEERGLKNVAGHSLIELG